MPRGIPLFESLLVFENYPIDASFNERSSTLEVRDFHILERFNYPLTSTSAPAGS